jgi:hypothetical protein
LAAAGACAEAGVTIALAISQHAATTMGIPIFFIGNLSPLPSSKLLV